MVPKNTFGHSMAQTRCPIALSAASGGKLIAGFGLFEYSPNGRTDDSDSMTPWKHAAVLERHLWRSHPRCSAPDTIADRPG